MPPVCFFALIPRTTATIPKIKAIAAPITPKVIPPMTAITKLTIPRMVEAVAAPFFCSIKISSFLNYYPIKLPITIYILPYQYIPSNKNFDKKTTYFTFFSFTLTISHKNIYAQKRSSFGQSRCCFFFIPLLIFIVSRHIINGVIHTVNYVVYTVSSIIHAVFYIIR